MLRFRVRVVTSDGKRLTLTPNNDNPQMVITFQDGTKLSVSGQNLIRAAHTSHLDHGQPHLICNGHILIGTRRVISTHDWTNQVKSVTVSQSAGPRGIYLALVAIGWGPAVRRRTDVLGPLEVEHVKQIKNGEDLLNWVTGMLRRDARSHFQVLNAV